jgi:hypothetical protein
MPTVVKWGDSIPTLIGEAVELPAVLSSGMKIGEAVEDSATNKILVTDGDGNLQEITNNATNWDTAYSWGNHASAGYLTSYTESDPIFVAHPAYAISAPDISNWNTAYGWGNHASAGYLTGVSEGTAYTGGTANGIMFNNGGAFGSSSSVTISSGNLTLDKGGLLNTILHINGSNDWSLIATSSDTFKLRNATSAADVFEVDSSNNITFNGSITGIDEGTSYTGGASNGLIYNDGDTFSTSADLTWDGATLRQNTSGQLKYEGYISNVRKWRFQSSGALNIFTMSVSTLFDGSRIAMGAYDSSPDARLDIGITSASEIGLIVEGANGQTADPFQINSYGNTGGNLYHLKADGTPNYSNMPTSSAGLSSGDLYQDTAANILSNGDLIVAIKQ